MRNKKLLIVENMNLAFVSWSWCDSKLITFYWKVNLWLDDKIYIIIWIIYIYIYYECYIFLFLLILQSDNRFNKIKIKNKNIN